MKVFGQIFQTRKFLWIVFQQINYWLKLIRWVCEKVAQTVGQPIICLN
jgi:hypothetical protein